MLFLPFYFFTLLLLSDNASLRTLYEVDNVLNLLGNLKILLDFLDTFLQYTLAVEQAVSLVDVLDGLIAETATAQTDEVDAAVAGWLFAGNDVWRNILRKTATALDHHVTCDMAELVNENVGADDGVVVYYHLTGKLGRVADNQAAAEHAVVSHVNGLHQEVVAAYYGLALRGCTTRDSNVLTDTVVIAHLAGCLLALELQVLRLGRDAGAWEKFIIVADASAHVDGNAVLQYVVIAQNGVLVDIAERTDNVVVTEFCLWMNKR